MSGKRVAIVQSNYIPWKGYFDLINSVDEFVLFDDVQYTRRDWRNRNRIKTPHGGLWLTIPVRVKGGYTQRICDTRISDAHWALRHWQSVQTFYVRAPYFARYKDWLADLYGTCTSEDSLSHINFVFLSAICQILGISTTLSWSSQYNLPTERNDRLIAICQQTGAQHYVSGPAAKVYLDEAAFLRAGITVHWMEYSGYPEYPQLFPPFEHAVSILDLLLNTGPDAPLYMKSFHPRRSSDIPTLPLVSTQQSPTAEGTCE
ncbi:MAG: WbqC family protein [Candidatus Binatia bacterium]